MLLTSCALRKTKLICYHSIKHRGKHAGGELAGPATISSASPNPPKAAALAPPDPQPSGSLLWGLQAPSRACRHQRSPRDSPGRQGEPWLPALCALLLQRENSPQCGGSLSSPRTATCGKTALEKLFTAHKSQRDILAQAASRAWHSSGVQRQELPGCGVPWDRTDCPHLS